jgi:hypothetical protein
VLHAVFIQGYLARDGPVTDSMVPSLIGHKINDHDRSKTCGWLVLQHRAFVASVPEEHDLLKRCSQTGSSGSTPIANPAASSEVGVAAGSAFKLWIGRRPPPAAQDTMPH